MNPSDLLRLLEGCQALLTDTHVVYTSGRHGDAYINKDAIYPDPDRVSALCAAIADSHADAGVEVVAAPALGGIILSQWVAHHLRQRGAPALAVYAEKTEPGFLFRRGYDQILRGRRVLCVEDILTTGTSLRDVVRAATAAGGQVIAAAALCNRGGVTAAHVHSPRLTCLLDVPLRSWAPGECPLCQRGVPVRTDVGKGREFLQEKRQSM